VAEPVEDPVISTSSISGFGSISGFRKFDQATTVEER
jgi:hypothetical protein